MNPMICFSACSLIYCLMLIIVSGNLKRGVERNKYFRFLLYFNCISLLLEVSGFFLGNKYNELKILNDVIFKLMLVFHIVWSTIMLLYVISINKKIDKKIKSVSFIVMFLGVILCFLLPINCNIKNGIVMNTYGMAVNFVYYYCFIMILIYIFALMKNLKKSNAVSYAPIFLYIVGGTITSMIQSSNPELVLSNSVDTLVIFSMYFTMLKADSPVEITNAKGNKKTEKSNT